MQVARVATKVVLGLAVCLLVTGKAAVVRAQSPFWRTALGVVAESLNNAHEHETRVRYEEPLRDDSRRYVGPHDRFNTIYDRELGLSLEVLPTSGLTVLDVDRNSPAQRAGLEFGDVLVRIEGRALNSRDDYFRAVRSGSRELNTVVRDIHSGRLVTARIRLPEVTRPTPTPVVDLCGEWRSTWGQVELTQTGEQLRGTIDLPGTSSDVNVTGHVHGNTAHYQLTRSGRTLGSGEWTITSAGRRLDGTLTAGARRTVYEFDLARN